ncbi:aminobenzoyl-glutamate utilization protein B [Povalibacter uvarum]|uniref:Aminobenzoyl-glutamate utilization protein B n=1 Tax=Povalibacter uvarum TaxID=732238 RepID=A0A841HPK3_9GAMM|nr:amidohydrolase [Povalibacter uvarum]MBB6095251.1 aminobenzoyl-glutamate utilization protein B [Povalibacter uvarum]
MTIASSVLRGFAALPIVASLVLVTSASAATSSTKKAAVQSVDQHSAELIGLSDQIWAFAETALKEHRSAAALADYAEKQGFKVERGVGDMPTAFIASFGSGRPIIGVMGEYDALPGISQKAVAEKTPLQEGAGGHGCGHNMFGAASLGAAVAIKEQIAAGKLKGTIRFYGTPAEENIGGKTYMARDGFFNDLDVVLAWHPGDKTQADTTSSQAMVDLAIEFRGKAAHAAGDPWNGRSAVDALELFTHGVNLMREHIKPTSRMHYTIVAGGDVPNVVPEYGKVWIWLRDWQRVEVEGLLGRVRRLAEGAATMTETTSTVTVQGGSWEILNNLTGAKLLNANLQWLGTPMYSADEQEFAKKIQRATSVPDVGMDTKIHPLENQEQEGGSTDVGDVSWIVPTLHFTVATSPSKAPWHAWPVVATGGMSIGHKGMVLASKTLAATMVDLYEQPATLKAVRAEFEQKRGGVVFDAYIPDGPPPVPKE